MDRIDLAVGKPIATTVLSHLASRAEMVAFMRGSIAHGEAVAEEAWLLSDKDLVLGQWHVELTDNAQQHLMTWALGAAVVVEAHSHGGLGGQAMFSRTDLEGLATWVPHLTWRVPGLTYVALVLGASTFDGLAWRAGAGPVAVGRISLQGEGEWQATGRSLRWWTQAADG
ncbi:MAG: hypothetical protein ACT452_11875 [Microthrixaceae bacterium]